MCAVVCHWQGKRANVILLTGLRLEALQASDKQVLFIAGHAHTHKSPLRTNNVLQKHFMSTNPQHEPAVIALEGRLIALLSSAELWRQPKEEVYTGKKL